MHLLDWFVLIGSMTGIAVYGIWKTRSQQHIDSYLRAGRSAPWYVVCFSVMATQASAITFLSTPGQGFADGMKFVQFYFGLPLAIFVVIRYFAPRYFAAGVYTAYEYLEERFNAATRYLAAALFLIQRGFAAGLTIYAPAIVFSTALGWDLHLCILGLGSLVTIYTVSGGTEAVNKTQMQQMLVILCGMLFAVYSIISGLPASVDAAEAWELAGIFGRTDALDFSLDPNSRYTVWSGLTGGFFLALSYFGTDQSQVQRYLGAASLKESSKGLWANAILKIPMQAGILAIGVLLFVFYQFVQAPLFFNTVALDVLKTSPRAEQYRVLEHEYQNVFTAKRELLLALVERPQDAGLTAEVRRLAEQEQDLRRQVKALMTEVDPAAETNDTDYVFIGFVLQYLPIGMVGLLIAAFTAAALSSTAGELNALAATSVIDFYRRIFRPDESDKHYVQVSRLLTAAWGILAVAFAMIASLFENLIQAVNIVGSLFYGTILGIFLAAFFLPRISSRDVLPAAILAEGCVLLLYLNSDIGFLWFNVIGAMLVVFGGLLFSLRAKAA